MTFTGHLQTNKYSEALVWTS